MYSDWAYYLTWLQSMFNGKKKKVWTRNWSYFFLAYATMGQRAEAVVTSTLLLVPTFGTGIHCRKRKQSQAKLLSATQTTLSSLPNPVRVLMHFSLFRLSDLLMSTLGTFLKGLDCLWLQLWFAEGAKESWVGLACQAPVPGALPTFQVFQEFKAVTNGRSTAQRAGIFLCDEGFAPRSWLASAFAGDLSSKELHNKAWSWEKDGSQSSLGVQESLALGAQHSLAQEYLLEVMDGRRCESGGELTDYIR